MKKKLKIYQKIILCVSCVIVLVMSFSIQAFAVASDNSNSSVHQTWQPIQLKLKQYTSPINVTSGDSVSQTKAEDPFYIYADNPSVSVGENQTYETVYTFYEPSDNGKTLLGTNRVTTTFVSSTGTIVNHFKPITTFGPSLDPNNTFGADLSVNVTSFYVSDHHAAPRIDFKNPLTYVQGISKDNIFHRAEVIYSGTLCYPRKTGGALNLPFYFRDVVPYKNYDPSNGDTFAFSLSPSKLNRNGNPTRLSQYEIYKMCYDSNSEWQSLVRDPEHFLTNDIPCKFIDLQVDYVVDTLSYDPLDDFSITELTSDLDQVQSRDIVISNPYDPDFVSYIDANWSNAVGYIIIGLQDTDWFGWLTNGIKDILLIEFFPNFYLWNILAIPLALCLIFWALKVFAGG